MRSLNPPIMLYDPGSSRHREDGMVVVGPVEDNCIAGALDGVSGPHCPAHPPILFNGLTGGEMVARTVEAVFLEQGINAQPLNSLLRANSIIGGHLTGRGIDTYDMADLPGTTFAVASVTQKKVEFFQAGDALAIWRKKNGDVGVTTNQVRAHDEVMNSEIRRLMTEVAAEKSITLTPETPKEVLKEIRDEMWNRFFDILREARRQNMNNPTSPKRYGLLCGSILFWEREPWSHNVFDRDEIETILLVTDGMFPWEVMKSQSDQEIAEAALKRCDKGGLAALIMAARGIEETTQHTSYIDHGEATGVLLRL